MSESYMKKVALHNLGCKVNSYELDAMQELLIEAGYDIVPFEERANIYIVNTCSVTNMADRKSRQMLHKAKKRNPKGIVIATGCYVQTKEEELKQDYAIDILIGNNKKTEIVTILEEYMVTVSHNETEARKANIIDINEPQEFEDMHISKTAEHTRAYIKIQDGCNQFCSYCIIPYARGRVRSRHQDSIIKEVKALVKNGYKEVVVTGIHISSYGIDFVNNNRVLLLEKEYLIQLLKEIQEIEGLERIRIGSLEPRIITEKFVKELSKLTKVCPHFHLSLQSGCDKTLKRMNRCYNVGEYYEKVQMLRCFFRNPAITTDIIVGFPEEEMEDFEMTKEYIEKIGFFEVHVFKYSKREGTKAAAMKNQVADTDKNERSELLLEITKEQRKVFKESYHNQKVEVLIEENKMIDGTSYWIGHTKEYIRVAIAGSNNTINQNVAGIVTGKLNEDLMIVEVIS